MSYKYFSQQLIDKNILDLSEVLKDKQDEAKVTGNVSYGLDGIVMYLKDVTDDWRFADRKYIDLDNAIQSVVARHYKSIGQDNPFEIDTIGDISDIDITIGNIPREAATIENGKLKGRGAAKTTPQPPKPAKVKPEPPEPTPPPTEPVEEDVASLHALKVNIESMEMYTELDEELDPDTMDLIVSQTLYMGLFESDEAAKQWYADNGFDYTKYIKE